jgi:hypothetical protein
MTRTNDTQVPASSTGLGFGKAYMMDYSASWLLAFWFEVLAHHSMQLYT